LKKVLVSLKIFPSGIDVNLNNLKNEVSQNLPDFASVYQFEEEPIAYGLVALIAHIILPEERSGGIEEVENNIKKIVQVSDFQTLMVRRV
jgi:elongation factor 1-beta